jgi:localization factor PodJL
VGEVMAYGVPWGDRDYEPDPREIVEEAARAAGMTVSEWLNRASYTSQDRQDYRTTRPPRQQRRFDSRYNRERGSTRDTAYREDRISRILDGAMENIEDSLRSNEERTASALEALEMRLRQMERPAPAVQNRPLSPQASDNADLVRTLENRISNVVNLLEAKSVQRSHARPAVDALSHEAIANAVRQELRQHGAALDGSAQTERLNAVEDALRQLSSKLDAAPLRQDNVQNSAFSSAIEDMQNAVRGLQHNHQQGEVLESIRQLEQRLAASESLRERDRGTDRGEALAQPLARIHEELNRLTQRTMGLDNLRPVDSGLQSIERQMGSISDRIDALTDKIATARLNGPRDLRAQKPVNSAFEELKSLIQQSQTPATDSRVLDSLQTLERKVEAMERGPTELASRLDRIQAMIGEKPAAPLPRNLEPLLQTIVSRLEQVQNGAGDDRAFDKLHQEIRQLSQKIEEAPRAQQMPAGSDISGVERHLTQLFQQIDALKDNMGEVAQRAASKAAQDTLTQQNLAPKSAAPDTAPFEKALSTIQLSQQEGERRTQLTLEAVHSTLQRVVDRLVDMERDIKAPPVPAALAAAHVAAPAVHHPAPAPAPPAMPVFVAPVAPAFALPEAPQFAAQPTERPAVVSRAKPLQDYALEEYAPEQKDLPTPPKVSPAFANPTAPVFDPELLPSAVNAADQSFTRSADNIRAERAFAPAAASSAAPMPEASAKGGIAGVFAAARNAVVARKKDKVGHDEVSFVPSAPGSEGPSAKTLQPSGLLDMPLEPGSGRPMPGQLPSSRADAPLVVPSSDPKAAFLAAARRAAQAAAEQSAEVLAQGQKKGMPGLSQMLSNSTASAKDGATRAAGAKVGLTKKHAILLGLAALIVAVGAAIQFTGSRQQASAPIKEAPERTSSLNPSARPPAGAAPATTASVQPRQILPAPSTEALPPPLETARRETPASTSAARDLAAREKAAREMIARTEERLTSASATRAATPSAAFGPLDTASVGSINPPAKPVEQAKAAAPLQGAALPAVNPVSTDPLFKFEGVRGAERLKEAAKAGDPNAFLELGNRFADGRGAPRDPKTAALWYERAAQFGSAPAQYRLASMYREGRGLERDPKIALKHFQAAAEAGNARAMHNTAVLLAEGVNGSPDYAGAADWFKKAAENGIKDSQFNLAILYARGLGTPQDLMASYAWFAAAGSQGDEDAIKKRDEVGTRLSPEKLAQAKTAAAAWKARTPDPAANEAVAPAGGWDDQARTVPAAAKPKAARS